MKETASKLTAFIMLLLAITACRGRGADTGNLYAELDAAIAHSPQYVAAKEARLAKMHRAAERASGAARERALLALYDEYRSYKSDSAIHCLNECAALAARRGDKATQQRCRALLAMQYSVIGAFAEATTLLSALQREHLSGRALADYYLACNHVYGELGFANNGAGEQLGQLYFKLAARYRDSIFATLPPDCEDVLLRRETQLSAADSVDAAFKVNDRRLARCRQGTHEYGVVAYYRYLLCRQKGDTAAARRWIMRSALCDVRQATMDQASLWILADMLVRDGDTRRAWSYINFSWQAATTFGTRIRSWQISPVLASIDRTRQTELHAANVRLAVAVAVVALVAVALVAMLFYVDRQKSLVTRARNDLRQANASLEQLNGQLNHANARLKAANTDLNESNRLKEEYIGQFLGACSVYIDKMEKTRLTANRLLRSRKYGELLELTSDTCARDREMEELYSNFDNIFLHLFPNFVADLNSLLRDDCQIKLADPSRLTAIVRVFALIRLGIDDSAKIAEFLHYALNTIYNYRARLRNGARGERADFEAKVKRLGMEDGC